MKVLVVDPDPESRGALRRAFAGAGEQVRGVTTLVEGGRQISELLPDAVVVAVDFSEAEVAQFFAEALRLEPRLALYALTGSAGREAPASASSRGARGAARRAVSPSRVGPVRARPDARRDREGWLEELR